MWTTTDDAREFLDVTGALLRANAASNTVLLTVAANVAENGPAFYGEEPPLFGWWAGTGGRIDGAFVHTPPHPALLSVVPHAAIDPLAELLARDRRLAGVSAGGQLAEAFGAAWSARRHTTTELAVRLRLYRLATLREPDRPAPGRADVATVVDEALMRDWMQAFEREIGEPPGASRTLAKRLAAGSLTIWRNARGTPVAIAGYSREADGTRRIGPVYTVTQHRRQGYGAAVTAAASRRALDSGTSQLLLYADVDNPTSNTLYQRLGFEPIETRTTLRFRAR
jgi:predicted GNAT family acetyltransferase